MRSWVLGLRGLIPAGGEEPTFRESMRAQLLWQQAYYLQKEKANVLSLAASGQLSQALSSVVETALSGDVAAMKTNLATELEILRGDRVDEEVDEAAAKASSHFYLPRGQKYPGKDEAAWPPVVAERADYISSIILNDIVEQSMVKDSQLDWSVEKKDGNGLKVCLCLRVSTTTVCPQLLLFALN